MDTFQWSESESYAVANALIIVACTDIYPSRSIDRSIYFDVDRYLHIYGHLPVV